MGLLFEVAAPGADMDPKYPSTDKAKNLKSISRSTRLVEVPIDFPSSLDELFPQCSTSVEVALGSNHCANVFGVLDNFHFAKLLTVCRHPVQQLMTTVPSILHATALPMIEIEPSHLIHHHEGRRQGAHQRLEERSSNRKIISIGTRRWLKKVWSGRISCDDRVVEPSKDRVKRHGE